MNRDDIKQLVALAFRELKIERVQGTETVESMLTHPSGRVVDLGSNASDQELYAARQLLWTKGDGLAIFITHLIFDELRCASCQERREEDSYAIESFCIEHVGDVIRLRNLPQTGRTEPLTKWEIFKRKQLPTFIKWGILKP